MYFQKLSNEQLDDIIKTTVNNYVGSKSTKRVFRNSFKISKAKKVNIEKYVDEFDYPIEVLRFSIHGFKFAITDYSVFVYHNSLEGKTSSALFMPKILYKQFGEEYANDFCKYANIHYSQSIDEAKASLQKVEEERQP